MDKFKYQEFSDNHTKIIKDAVNDLRVLPKRYTTTDFSFRGYDIYLKPYRTYLLFFTVNEETGTVTILRILKDGMNWQFILRKWISEQEDNRHSNVARIYRRVVEMLYQQHFFYFYINSLQLHNNLLLYYM